MHRIPAVGLIVLVPCLPKPASTQAATPSATSPSAVHDDFVGLVDIGGCSLIPECRGEGSPTVIQEVSAGNDTDIRDAVRLPPRGVGLRAAAADARRVGPSPAVVQSERPGRR